MKIPKHLTAHNKTIRDAVMSGDDAYDVTYTSINTMPALVAAGASTVSSDKDGNLYYSAGEEHYFPRFPRSRRCWMSLQDLQEKPMTPTLMPHPADICTFSRPVGRCS